MHRHQHIVQTPCEKEFSGKDIKDGTMLKISSSQYEWTDNLTDVNDIFTLFIISSNTHITNVLLKEVLIKEVLTDTPLLIIKENINCDNFLNKDGFNFLTRRVNYKSLTNFPIIVVDERLYGKALFSHNKIDSNTYKTDRIMANFVNFLNSSYSDIDRLYYNYSYTTTQREHTTETHTKGF